MLIVRAPVRISFGGGGTDLAAYYHHFGGFVVSAAITRYCYVVANEPADTSIHIASSDYHVRQSFPAGTLPPVDEPLSLPKAVVDRFAKHGVHRKGIELFLASDVSPGTGLGSSSAMAAALVRALGAYCEVPLSSSGVAEIACAVEIDRLGMPIGKQDQYASAYGGFNAITFTTAGVTVQPLKLPPDVLTSLALRLMLFSTGKSRRASQILGEQRRETETNPAVTASLHRIKERAHEMIAALQARNLDRFGALLHLAWEEKKRLSSRISSSAIDTWYRAARAAGALGGKITGAGGGGFLLLYCPPEYQHSVRSVMTGFGLCEMSFDFEFHGADIVGLAHRDIRRRVAIKGAVPGHALAVQRGGCADANRH